MQADYREISNIFEVPMLLCINDMGVLCQFQFVELLVAGCWAVRMDGAKGCGSVAASLARPVRSELECKEPLGD